MSCGIVEKKFSSNIRYNFFCAIYYSDSHDKLSAD